MQFHSARRFLRACTLATASAAALAAVGTSASAAVTPCSGSNIAGQGASVEKIAMQSVWDPNFNTSSDPAACAGTQGSGGKPVVTYTSNSSSIGLESWGVNKHAALFGPTNALIGTEEPPNATEKSEIEANETTLLPATVQSVPVLQESIAVLIHLPAGCTATSTSQPGRLVLNESTLQGIFLGTINTWGAITDGGDQITGAGCAAAPIQRVVRLDSAGATHIFKKFLALINASPFEAENGETLTWSASSEGAGNNVWPKAAIAVIRPAKTGNSAEVAKVAETAGSVGFAGLADSRANPAFAPPAGGTGTAVFWAPIQNNGVSAKVAKYSDPSSNGEALAPSSANCAKTKYTNGSGTKFPPKTTAQSWSEVTTATKETNYPICGLGYLLSLSKYSAYPAGSEGGAITANGFLHFVLSTGAAGGQALLVNHDYEPLPSNVLKIALKGAQATAF
jgi:ABC-type phosphate transport system substrate-binding protein